MLLRDLVFRGDLLLLCVVGGSGPAVVELWPRA